MDVVGNDFTESSLYLTGKHFSLMFEIPARDGRLLQFWRFPNNRWSNWAHTWLVYSLWDSFLISLIEFTGVYWRLFYMHHTCRVTLDISGSPIHFHWGSRKYPGQLDVSGMMSSSLMVHAFNMGVLCMIYFLVTLRWTPTVSWTLICCSFHANHSSHLHPTWWVYSLWDSQCSVSV